MVLRSEILIELPILSSFHVVDLSGRILSSILEMPAPPNTSLMYYPFLHASRML